MSGADWSPSRGRRRLLLLVAVLAAVIGLLAISGLEHTTTYYLTPTEAAASPISGPVRLAGQVKDGTLNSEGDQVRFVLTDGATDIPVVSAGALPRIFHEGEGAVVEGTLGRDSVLRADQVMVRHSNEYRPAPGS